MSNDEKPKSRLGDFLSKVQDGAQRLNGLRPERENEPTIGAPENAPAPDREHPRHDAYDEESLLLDIQADEQAQQPKPTAKLSQKKGLILVGLLIVAATIYQNFRSAPSNDAAQRDAKAEAAAENPSVDLTGSKPSDDAAEAEFGFDTQGHDLDNAVGQTLDALQLNGPLQVAPAPKQELPASPEAADASPFGFPDQAPLTAADGSTPTRPGTSPTWPASGSPFGVEHSMGAESLTAVPTEKVPATTSTTRTPTANKVALPAEKGDAILAGVPSENPDSKQLPSLQGNAEAEMSEMQAKLALQEKAIADLQARLKAAESKPRPQPRAVNKTSADSAKPKTYATIPAVAKVGPRPKICVKAVAPPARNCSTCVAHAFLVDTNLEEIMIGQGDFIAGYRASITGDRLDLQNSVGDVVHKFWSQPNGCPAI